MDAGQQCTWKTCRSESVLTENAFLHIVSVYIVRRKYIHTEFNSGKFVLNFVLICTETREEPDAKHFSICSYLEYFWCATLLALAEFACRLTLQR